MKGATKRSQQSNVMYICILWDMISDHEIKELNIKGGNRIKLRKKFSIIRFRNNA